MTDLDKLPYVSARKKARMAEFEGLNNKGNIIVVVEEIEDWYIAGLILEKIRKDFNIDISKSKIRSGKRLLGKIRKSEKEEKFKSDIDFMLEILKNYFDVNLAKKRNTSFRYFMEKYLYE